MKPVFLLLGFLAMGRLQESKVAVPSDDALKAAEKTVRDTFPAEEGGPLKRAKLLLDRGRETKDNDALRYVLFREAADAASRAGAIDTMVHSLHELYSTYSIPTLSLKEAVHLRAEAGTKPEDLKRLAEADLNLSQEAVDHDQGEIAAKMAQASMSLARKSKDSALIARGEAAARTATDAKAAFEKARKAEEALAAAPEDAAANQAWGEWLCLHKGRWDKGLPFLTKGVDGPIRTAAVKEFSSSAEPSALVEVGDAWWDLMDREKSAVRRQQLLAHARSVYATALPRSTGLIRAKIGRRLEFDRDAPSKEAVGREESEALKAEAALAANPNDPAANLSLGKYLAFQKNEWSAAMPRLAKGSDPVLKALAEKELAEPRTGPEKMDLGDAWSDAATKLPALKKNLLDRATHWHVQAWPSLDPSSKDKLRERFRKMFQTAGSIGKAPPKEWAMPASELKAGVSSAAPRTGRNGFQILCARSKEGPSVVLSQSVAARPLASYELSCWVVADETNGADELQASVQTRDSRIALQPSVSSSPDQPWLKRLEARFTAPETAAKITVAFSVKSTKGTLFLDDLSLKQDGKELLKNGSFDE